MAKKGPLGTIWIAAHLERKLRKNQVADTDIGVSVGKFPYLPYVLYVFIYDAFILFWEVWCFYSIEESFVNSEGYLLPFIYKYKK